MGNRWFAIGLALAACGGSGSSTDQKEAPPSPPPPPPKVQLLRCAPAAAMPYVPTPDAGSAGILGTLQQQQGGAFASLTGTGDISSGFDDTDIQGGLLGSDAGSGFGFGRSGFGPGGGGTGWGTIGTGRYGTIGHGAGTGNGYGVGGGRGGMRGRSASVPTVRIGQANAVGDLDKAIIRRYIKRNIAKITYCYEKQLLAKPALEGTLSTQFFIRPDGNVADATASGVDPDVASCVADVIKSIQFPKPKGGGGVQVSYPFTFRPSDDAAAPPAPPTAGLAWTPYAVLDSSAPRDEQGAVTLATQAAVQTRLAALDACYGARTHGTIRALLDVNPAGAIDGVRAGGLGDAAVEACVSQALGAIKIAGPPHPNVEVACDVARGPEEPWRVTPDGYDVIEVGKLELRHGGAKLALTATVGDLTKDLLVIADPDANGAALLAAGGNAPVGRATIYALRDGHGAPLYLGAARDTRAPLVQTDDARLALTFHPTGVDVCVSGTTTTATAAYADPKALGDVLARAVKTCDPKCSDVAIVAPGDAPDAAKIATTIARVRAAGFTRVIIGGALDRCAP
ncbi:MAG TPA: AgmX/PglI C-terminal domain-containing protein [Kofleriaceae bacterium]|nr:AgmX/PglI C-terminal domain-containing protein [Kofleriaceae bacterium]